MSGSDPRASVDAPFYCEHPNSEVEKLTYYNYRLPAPLLNIFNKATDGISILKNGIFIDCNYATVNILQYKTKQDILNLTPSQLSPKLQPDGQSSLEKAQQMIKIAIQKGSKNFQWKHLRADGSEFWVDVTLTDISENDDEIIHAVWRDISESLRLKRGRHTGLSFQYKPRRQKKEGYLPL